MYGLAIDTQHEVLNLQVELLIKSRPELRLCDEPNAVDIGVAQIDLQRIESDQPAFCVEYLVAYCMNIKHKFSSAVHRAVRKMAAHPCKPAAQARSCRPQTDSELWNQSPACTGSPWTSRSAAVLWTARHRAGQPPGCTGWRLASRGAFRPNPESAGFQTFLTTV